MKYEVINKLRKNKKYLEYLRENSNYYKDLNRDEENYYKFVNKMKEKYKLRTIDKVDTFVDSVDIITKIIDASSK